MYAYGLGSVVLCRILVKQPMLLYPQVYLNGSEAIILLLQSWWHTTERYASGTVHQNMAK